MDTKNLFEKGTIWGLLLVAGGALLLLQTLGIFHGAGTLTVGLGFLLGGAAFTAVYVRNRNSWWALFPAFGMGFIGLAIIGDLVLPRLDLGGLVFLGGLGLVFALIYAGNRQHFWPIIPAGSLFTLALISGVNDLLPFRFDDGWIFFTGLALTFGFVWYESRQRAQWALVVALILGGLAFLTIAGSLIRYLFPVALVLVGVYMLTRPQRNSGGPQ